MPFSEIKYIDFVDEEQGIILFGFGWLEEHIDIKEAIVDFMRKDGYAYLKDYTINTTKGRDRNHERVLAVWLKDDQDFLLMKLKHG